MSSQIDNYEKNLKLNYDAIRKDLDILLTNTIPTQKNLMKTYLWLNTTIIGFVITIYSTNGIIFGFLLIPFVFSFIAILGILSSLSIGQVKTFGHIDIDEMEKIEIDEYEHTKGIFKMLHSTKTAFTMNIDVVSTRAKSLKKSLFFTKLSFVSIFLLAVLIINLQ